MTSISHLSTLVWRRAIACAATLCLIAPVQLLAADNPPRVVVSIKPIHSLAASIMQGVGQPRLLVDGAASPHGFSLKPSQAKVLQNADLVFWVGPSLEAFLEKPITTVAAGARSIELIDAVGLQRLDRREGGNFEAAHSEHGDKHDGHGHAGHDHAGHEIDPHIWLDPLNAAAIADAIANALSQADPKNASRYMTNAEQLRTELDQLIAETKSKLGQASASSIVVFHDAYQYFEKRFGLRVVGSVTVNPEVPASARQIGQIRRKLRSLNTGCTFAEPQFDSAALSALVGPDAKIGIIDPLGASIPGGPGHYASLIRNMTRAIQTCTQD